MFKVYSCICKAFVLCSFVFALKLQHNCCWTEDINSTAKRNNNIIFTYQDINDECKRNEYYDLNEFVCSPCGAEDRNLIPTKDKLSCQCATPPTNTVQLYDPLLGGPYCSELCKAHSETRDQNDSCRFTSTSTTTRCKYKYINSSDAVGESTKQILITPVNINDAGDCERCNLKYNFNYQDYCIANALMRPYLKYNGFWSAATTASAAALQPSITTGHFGELKYVAFFCLALNNATACNHLANLCVLTMYSTDKNSPCSVFLLTQASEVVMRYASIDEQFEPVKPYLYFRKGKQTEKLLGEPIESGSSYSLNENEQQNLLQFFSMTYSLDGTLRRWGPFKLSHVDLCRLQRPFKDQNHGTMTTIRFARHYEFTDCTVSLEYLIDLAEIYANNYYTSLYLNYTNENNHGKCLMHTVPILIENLTAENRRQHSDDWQLVKRFQFIEAQPTPRYGLHHRPSIPRYEDAHKLTLYRSIRYIDKFEILYKIYNGNRIGVPFVRLSYRSIDIDGNASLNDMYKFQLLVTFTKVDRAGHGDVAQRQVLWWLEWPLPLLLLAATAAALLRTYNAQKRKQITTTASASVSTRTTSTTSMDFCDVQCMSTFVFHLVSYASNALLANFLLYVVGNSLQFLTQSTVGVTLPLNKNDNYWNFLISTALLLKLIYVCINFWCISHADLFFIDWERPRSSDNNHFNLKSNLETSSVCSSVRTFTSECNVSAWRVFFMANEWIRLSVHQKTSVTVQGVMMLVVFELFERDHITSHDIILELFLISIVYIAIFALQLICRCLVVNCICVNPVQKFIDLCSLGNVSVLALLQSSYGFYIHGRSPHGFADTDISSMIVQLQRESQNMCSRRGLLNDSDQQTYIILPPKSMQAYFEKLVKPFQRSYNISQMHYQKESASIEGSLEKTYVAYSTVNRFFCAFIDHAIKDMDYIIKEKTFMEKLLNCEFDNYLSENKGTFYIDTSCSFTQLFLYGNSFEIFLLEILILLTVYTLTMNLIVTIALIYFVNKMIQCVFRHWTRQSINAKTLIDKRFLF